MHSGVKRHSHTIDAVDSEPDCEVDEFIDTLLVAGVIDDSADLTS